MVKTIFYKNADDVYTPDSCKPLKAAMETGKVRASAWSRGQYPGVRLSKSLLPGIRSIGIWDIEDTQNWYIQPHHNEGIEVCMVLSGNLNFEVDGSKCELKRGSVTLTKPWQLHSLGAPEIHPNKLIWFILDVGVRRPNSSWAWPNWFLATKDEKEKLGDSIIFARQNVFSANPRTIQIFDEMFALIEDGDFAGITKTGILINSALLALQQLLNESGQNTVNISPSEETVRQFFIKLVDHLSYPWKLEEMADQCGISRSQFSNLCKEITNQSPMTKLTNIRLDRAAELLENAPAKSITDICFDCGFNSSQYFSKRFVERFGIPPRTFRKGLLAA